MRGEDKLRQETVYQPNIVPQVTPVTTLVPETVVEQIPTTRMTYQDERILRKEPYQVMRMVQEERVREIPETRDRQVVERVQQTTPVQVYRMETQEVARDIPITTYKTVSEERAEQYTVKVPRIEKIVETVQKPYIVQKRIPLDEFGNPTTIYPEPVLTPTTSPSSTTTTTMPGYGGVTGDSKTNAPADTSPSIPPSHDVQGDQGTKPNPNQMSLGSGT